MMAYRLFAWLCGFVLFFSSSLRASKPADQSIKADPIYQDFIQKNDETRVGPSSVERTSNKCDEARNQYNASVDKGSHLLKETEKFNLNKHQNRHTAKLEIEKSKKILADYKPLIEAEQDPVKKLELGERSTSESAKHVGYATTENGKATTNSSHEKEALLNYGKNLEDAERLLGQYVQCVRGLHQEASAGGQDVSQAAQAFESSYESLKEQIKALRELLAKSKTQHGTQETELAQQKATVGEGSKFLGVGGQNLSDQGAMLKGQGEGAVTPSGAVAGDAGSTKEASKEGGGMGDLLVPAIVGGVGGFVVGMATKKDSPPPPAENTDKKEEKKEPEVHTETPKEECPPNSKEISPGVCEVIQTKTTCDAGYTLNKSDNKCYEDADTDVNATGVVQPDCVALREAAGMNEGSSSPLVVGASLPEQCL